MHAKFPTTTRMMIVLSMQVKQSGSFGLRDVISVSGGLYYYPDSRILYQQISARVYKVVNCASSTTILSSIWYL